MDSAVAAAFLLQRQGCGLGASICAYVARRPRRTGHLQALAQRLGIPLTVIDLREEFARQVVDYFVAEYFRGRTPNPCVRCNAAIKFGRLWEWSRPRGDPPGHRSLCPA